MKRTTPPDISKILIPEEMIKQRVQELANQITQDYSDVKNLYIVGVLKGAFIFLADLSRVLSIPHTVDFMALSSYGKTTSSGEVRILMDLREPIEGRHLLLVEDILDTGNTLSYLIKILLDRKPASLRTCVLTQKDRQGLPDNVQVDYLGFKIPDVWVVGYGLDFADKYRTLPYIAELKQSEEK